MNQEHIRTRIAENANADVIFMELHTKYGSFEGIVFEEGSPFSLLEFESLSSDQKKQLYRLASKINNYEKVNNDSCSEADRNIITQMIDAEKNAISGLEQEFMGLTFSGGKRNKKMIGGDLSIILEIIGGLSYYYSIERFGNDVSGAFDMIITALRNFQYVDVDVSQLPECVKVYFTTLIGEKLTNIFGIISLGAIGVGTAGYAITHPSLTFNVCFHTLKYVTIVGGVGVSAQVCYQIGLYLSALMLKLRDASVGVPTQITAAIDYFNQEIQNVMDQPDAHITNVNQSIITTLDPVVMYLEDNLTNNGQIEEFLDRIAEGLNTPEVVQIGEITADQLGTIYNQRRERRSARLASFRGGGKRKTKKNKSKKLKKSLMKKHKSKSKKGGKSLKAKSQKQKKN